MKFNIFVLLLAVIASACSELSRPDSPEPTITLYEATDIARTEATVKASIDRHGGASLSYVKLHYDQISNESSTAMTIDADPSAAEVEFHLTGLAAGGSYTCHIEAGTATASLKSNDIIFTTIPNEAPKLSEMVPLSTGPLGIIVRFSIEDDGGEPIIEAGCEIKEDGGTESRRIYAQPLYPTPKYYLLNITGLTPSTSYTLTPFASNSRGETRGETLDYTTMESVIMYQPGMLSSLFVDSGHDQLDHLTIAGPMNGDDFRTLRAMLGAPVETEVSLRLSSIDLTDVSIVAGGSSYDGEHFTAANRISTGLFADCTGLRDIHLPNSAVTLESDAFLRCNALELLTIPAGVKTLYLSSGCTALKTIDVSGANSCYSSDEGVLMNADGSEIIWFPSGRIGEYNVPPTVTSISRGAFAESALSEIRLPDNLSNISEGMFQNCSRLTTVRLGRYTQYVGDYAFDGTPLANLYVSADLPPYAAEKAFTDRVHSLTDACTLYVPVGSQQLYRNHKRWGTFKKIEEFKP